MEKHSFTFSEDFLSKHKVVRHRQSRELYCFLTFMYYTILRDKNVEKASDCSELMISCYLIDKTTLRKTNTVESFDIKELQELAFRIDESNDQWVEVKDEW